ncbi:hypothetical protein TWF106_001333 [Orbilia oligospora]|uniref:Enoyl reductase (ER) domain-containing protein n=2 Tax=Orbilia oligospora TaxID=2813651 RepID=A0A7C8QTR8_ORBOL|nr:hypothetical protein TWF679_001643 [Orbilia oligospora]KAF3226117.1 hypothetical protein TWF106_001333 [Orbilia oligospora]
MTDSMKALRYHGAKDLRVESVPIPELLPGQVKVKPEWCGICGTDLHEYTTGPILTPAVGKPHRLTGCTVPLIMGHEFAGEIVELGPGVEPGRLKVGMKVCIEPALFDDTCPPCLDRRRNCCDRGGFFGLSGWGGGFSEYACLQEKLVHPLPDNVPTDIGALVEPLAVAWHALKAAGHTPDRSALIVGAGPIGLAVLFCLLARGCRQILISEVSPQRIKHALEIASSHPEVDIRVLDPTKEDVVVRAKELCSQGNQGPNVVYDCAGVQKSIDAAIGAVRKGGVVCNVAVWEKPPSIDMNALVFGEKKLIGVALYDEGDFQEVIEAISTGKIRNPEKLITAKVALDDAVTNGFEALLKSREHVKILVRP